MSLGSLEQNQGLLDEDFLLDSNSKEQMEQDALFQEMEKRLKDTHRAAGQNDDGKNQLQTSPSIEENDSNDDNADASYYENEYYGTTQTNQRQERQFNEENKHQNQSEVVEDEEYEQEVAFQNQDKFIKVQQKQKNGNALNFEKDNQENNLQNQFSYEKNRDEDDIAIDKWKDTRLKKLEDFTKDIISNAKENKFKVPPSLTNNFKGIGSQIGKEGELKSTQSKYSIELTPNQQNYKRGQINVLSSSSNNNQQMPNSFNYQEENIKKGNFNMIERDCKGMEYEGGVDSSSFDNQQNSEYKSQGALCLEDEFMLTRTEGTLKNGGVGGYCSTTNVLSTQRTNMFQNNNNQLNEGTSAAATSINQNNTQVQDSGEFEKRITDIKQKLNQIKNTINNEIENSFIQMSQSKQQHQHQSRYQESEQKQQQQNNQYQVMEKSNKLLNGVCGINLNSNNFQGESSQSLSNQVFQREEKNKNQNNNNEGGNQLQNSVISSLDKFQDRLNCIKSNLYSNFSHTSQQQAYQYQQTFSNGSSQKYMHSNNSSMQQQQQVFSAYPLSSSTQTTNQNHLQTYNSSISTFQQQLQQQPTNCNEEKEKFNKLKHIIDTSYQKSPSKVNKFEYSKNINNNLISNQSKLDEQMILSEQLSGGKKTIATSSLIPQSLEQTVNLSSLRNQESQQKHSLQIENEKLKQKLQVLAHGEQVLAKQLESQKNESQQEKDRYEEQLRKMQEEISKMCEIMQVYFKKQQEKKGGRSQGKENSHKKEKRKRSHERCGKKQKIKELERQVKELQDKLKTQKQSPQSNDMISPPQIQQDINQNVQQKNQTQIKEAKRKGGDRGKEVSLDKNKVEVDFHQKNEDELMRMKQNNCSDMIYNNEQKQDQINNLEGENRKTSQQIKQQSQAMKENISSNLLKTAIKNLDLPQSLSTVNSEKALLSNQLNFLEQRLHQFQKDMKDNTEAQKLREKLKIQIEENDQLRSTYNKSYNEIVDAFNQFKKEMDQKQKNLDQQYDAKIQQIEGKFVKELESKSVIVDELKKENNLLRDKMSRIKDMFDIEVPIKQKLQARGNIIDEGFHHNHNQILNLQIDERKAKFFGLEEDDQALATTTLNQQKINKKKISGGVLSKKRKSKEKNVLPNCGQLEKFNNHNKQSVGLTQVHIKRGANSQPKVN